MDESTLETTSTPQIDLIKSIESKFSCKINLDIAEEVIESAIARYDSLPNNNDTQPENDYILFLEDQGFDKEEILNVVFFISTLMFQTNTSMFFDRLSRDPKEFGKYSWIFNPYKMFSKGREATRRACIEYLQPIGMQKKALDGWYHNAEVLMDNYDGNLSNFFLRYNNYAPDICEAIYVFPRAKSYRKEFHRLGPKLANLFLQWVERYNLYDLKDFDKVGLPIDYQLMRISLQTGIIELDESVNAHNLSFNILLPLFMNLCEKNDWKPRIVSEALWSLGSIKCSNEGETADPECPIKDCCKGVIRGNHAKDKFPPLEENPAFYKWEQ